MNNFIGLFFMGFGGFWIIISSAVFVPLLTMGSDDPAAVALMGLPFILIGIGFSGAGAYISFQRKMAVKHGIHYYGKIVSYQKSDTVRVNNRPLLYLEVRYYDQNNIIRDVQVSTGSGSARGYNLGETVHICEYKGKFIIAGVRSENRRIPGEENLIMSYNSRATSIDQLRPESYYCPHCGANLMIPRGQTVKCPYCDSFVTNTRQFA